MIPFIQSINNKHSEKRDINFYYVQHILKNRQKPDLISAHYKQHFKYIMSCTELRNFTTLKLFRQINKIGSMKSFVKPNCNLCMEERLIILKIYVIKASHLRTKIWKYMGLLSQNNFLLVFPDQLRSHYWVKVLDHTKYLNSLYLKKINSNFEY